MFKEEFCVPENFLSSFIKIVSEEKQKMAIGMAVPCPGGPSQGTSEAWSEGTKKSVAIQNIAQL